MIAVQPRPEAQVVPPAALLWQVARGTGAGWVVGFAPALYYLLGALLPLSGASRFAGRSFFTPETWGMFSLLAPAMAVGVVLGRWSRLQRVEFWRGLPFSRRQVVLGELTIDIGMVTAAVLALWLPVAGQVEVAAPLAFALALSGVAVLLGTGGWWRSIALTAVLVGVPTALALTVARRSGGGDPLLLPSQAAPWLMVLATLLWWAVARRDLRHDAGAPANGGWRRTVALNAAGQVQPYGGALALPGTRPGVTALTLTWATACGFLSPLAYVVVSPVWRPAWNMLLFAVLMSVVPASLVLTSRGEFLLTRPVSRARIATTVVAIAVAISLTGPAVRAARTAAMPEADLRVELREAVRKTTTLPRDGAPLAEWQRTYATALRERIGLASIPEPSHVLAPPRGDGRPGGAHSTPALRQAFRAGLLRLHLLEAAAALVLAGLWLLVAASLSTQKRQPGASNAALAIPGAAVDLGSLALLRAPTPVLPPWFVVVCAVIGVGMLAVAWRRLRDAEIT